MWFKDKDFIAWLDKENIGTSENPIDDDTLDLMYRAWLAGIEQG